MSGESAGILDAFLEVDNNVRKGGARARIVIAHAISL
jgi:hypothetical protein